MKKQRLKDVKDKIERELNKDSLKNKVIQPSTIMRQINSVANINQETLKS